MSLEQRNTESDATAISPPLGGGRVDAAPSAFELLSTDLDAWVLATEAPPRAGTSIAPPQRPWWSGLIATTGKVGLLVILAWGLLFNFSEVRGSSMSPGIHDRDRILVDQVSYLLGDVTRGDVVVLRYPLDPSLDYIKRVVGLPGDEITILGGDLFINGDLVTEPYVDAASVDPYTRLHVRVAEGHYFVLGDNRLRSSDSREFGQVPHDLLRGKVRMRVWPPDRAGWIE